MNQISMNHRLKLFNTHKSRLLNLEKSNKSEEYHMNDTKAQLERRIENILADPSKPIGDSALMTEINKDEEHKTCQTDELYPKKNANDFNGKTSIRQLWLVYSPKDAYKYHPHMTRFQRIRMRQERNRLIKEELLGSETSELYDEIDSKEDFQSSYIDRSRAKSLKKTPYIHSESEKIESSNNSEVNDSFSPFPTEKVLKQMNAGNLSPPLMSKQNSKTPLKEVGYEIKSHTQQPSEKSKESGDGIQKLKSGYFDASISNPKQSPQLDNSEVSSGSDEIDKFKMIIQPKNLDYKNKSKSSSKNTAIKSSLVDDVIPHTLHHQQNVTSQFMADHRPTKHKRSKKEDSSKKSRLSKSQISRTSTIIKSFRGNTKISGISRLSTVRKEAEIKVKAYFTENVEPNLNLKLKKITEDLTNQIKHESMLHSQNNFDQMSKAQKEFQEKSEKIIEECHARTKEMEDNLLSDVLGFYKKNKRSSNDK